MLILFLAYEALEHPLAKKTDILLLIFPCCSSNLNIVDFTQLYDITFKLRSIIKLKYLWVMKHHPFYILLPTLMQPHLLFLVLRALASLYLGATSIPVNMYLHVFPSNILWGTYFMRFFHIIVKVICLFMQWYMNLLRCFLLTRTWYCFWYRRDFIQLSISPKVIRLIV